MKYRIKQLAKIFRHIKDLELKNRAFAVSLWWLAKKVCLDAGGIKMTVGELIKMLKEFDQGKEVYNDNGFSIEDVTEDDDGVYIA